mmetsp:Transcript_15711/g.40023  ORF Transcript_15711/g.40023 Transcript_15711/m.40023 type:complete len:370 (+) Transcript_15711:976-2085(+)
MARCLRGPRGQGSSRRCGCGMVLRQQPPLAAILRTPRRGAAAERRRRLGAAQGLLDARRFGRDTRKHRSCSREREGEGELEEEGALDRLCQFGSRQASGFVASAASAGAECVLAHRALPSRLGGGGRLADRADRLGPRLRLRRVQATQDGSEGAQVLRLAVELRVLLRVALDLLPRKGGQPPYLARLRARAAARQGVPARRTSRSQGARGARAASGRARRDFAVRDAAGETDDRGRDGCDGFVDPAHQRTVRLATGVRRHGPSDRHRVGGVRAVGAGAGPVREDGARALPVRSHRPGSAAHPRRTPSHTLPRPRRRRGEGRRPATPHAAGARTARPRLLLLHRLRAHLLHACRLQLEQLPRQLQPLGRG